MAHLVIPSVQYETSYRKALAEAKDDTGDTQLNKPKENETFSSFATRLQNLAKGIDLPEGYVPDNVFWLIDNNEFIGRISIRHKLTDHLRKIGGHIGYYIRPSQRNKGYGKKILQLALEEAKKLDLQKVLITCDDNNLGSRKIIEANGGILEDIIHEEVGQQPKRRYWITIN